MLRQHVTRRDGVWIHPDRQDDSDMMTVVMLRLGRKGENSGDDAIRLLSKMFSMDLSYEDKLDALQNEFKIRVSKEMSDEVQSMCNLSVGVLNKGKMERQDGTGQRDGL